MENKKILLIIFAVVFMLVALLASLYLSSPVTITIKTSPQDSAIFLNGDAVERDEDSDSVQYTTKRGKHSIRVAANGYLVIEETFKTKMFGPSTLEYTLQKGEALINGLPYEDKENNFYIYGYYNDKYEPTYKIELFKEGARESAVTYLSKRGIDPERANLVYTEEYDKTGEAAPY